MKAPHLHLMVAITKWMAFQKATLLRQLFSQMTIHNWLHGWLCIHVPLSITLLVLGILHVIMSVYY